MHPSKLTDFSEAVHELLRAADALQAIAHPSGEQPVDMRAIALTLKQLHGTERSFQFVNSVISAFTPHRVRFTDFTLRVLDEPRLHEILKSMVDAALFVLANLDRSVATPKWFRDTFAFLPGSIAERVFLTLYPEEALA